MDLLVLLLPYVDKSQLESWCLLNKKLEILCLRELALRKWTSLHWNLKEKTEEKKWLIYLISLKVSIVDIIKYVEAEDITALSILYKENISLDYYFLIEKALEKDKVKSLKFLISKGVKFKKYQTETALYHVSFNCLKWLKEQNMIDRSYFSPKIINLVLEVRFMNSFEDLTTHLSFIQKCIDLLNWIIENFNMFPDCITKELLYFIQSKPKVIIGLDFDFFSFDFRNVRLSDFIDFYEDDHLLINKSAQNLELIPYFNEANIFLIDHLNLCDNIKSKEIINSAILNNNLPLIKHLIKNKNYKLDRGTLEKIVDVKTLVWLAKHNIKPKNLQENIKFAVSSNLIEFLNWAESQGFLPTPYDLESAVGLNYVRILDWAEKRNIFPEPDVLDKIANHFNLNTIDWLLKRGYQVNQRTIDADHFEMIVLYSEYGLLLENNHYINGTDERDIEISNWLIKKGVN